MVAHTKTMNKPQSCTILKNPPFGIMYMCKELCDYYNECVAYIKAHPEKLEGSKVEM